MKEPEKSGNFYIRNYPQEDSKISRIVTAVFVSLYLSPLCSVTMSPKFMLMYSRVTCDPTSGG